MASIQFKDGSVLTKSGAATIVALAAEKQFNVAKRAVMQRLMADTDELWAAMPEAEFATKTDAEKTLRDAAVLAVASVFGALPNQPPHKEPGGNIIIPE